MKQDMTPLKRLYLIYNTNPSFNWRENIKLDVVNEYIIKDQKDELIYNRKLEEDFLSVYNKLGLFSD